MLSRSYVSCYEHGYLDKRKITIQYLQTLQEICECNTYIISIILVLVTKIKIYRTIIFPVVLYGCETWSLTLTEERRLSVFENRVLRRVFGPKRDEVTGE